MPPETTIGANLPEYELKIPAVLMRCGTSRSLIFKREDLPGAFEENRHLGTRARHHYNDRSGFIERNSPS